MNFCHTRNQAKFPILFHSPQQVFGIFESWEMEMSLLPVLAIFSSSSTLLFYLKQTCPSSCPCGLEGAGRGMQKGASPVQPPWLPPLPRVAQGKCKGQMQNQGEKEWQTGGHISLPSQKEKKYKGRGVCGREGSHLCQLPILHPGPQSSHKVVLGFHLPCNSTFKRVHSVVTPLSSLIMLSPWVRLFTCCFLPPVLLFSPFFSFLETQLKPCAFREAFSGQLSPIYFGTFSYIFPWCPVCSVPIPHHLSNVCSPSPTYYLYKGRAMSS